MIKAVKCNIKTNEGKSHETKNVVITSDLIPQETIADKILLIRGKRIMLDRDLADLYRVTTGNLNKAVKRNIERFPEDFMFKLNKGEADSLRFRFGSLKKELQGGCFYFTGGRSSMPRKSLSRL